MTRTELIIILEDYSKWLEKHGYLDIDWRAEEPLAINEYLNDKGIVKEKRNNDIKKDTDNRIGAGGTGRHTA